MLKPRFLISLFLVAVALAFPAQAAQPAMRLFQIFQDYGETRPLENSMYRLQLDGRHLKFDVTDKTGAIVTEHRHPKTRQEFVADIWMMGTYVFVVDPNDKITVNVLNRDTAQERYESCSPKDRNCAGKGFYWIRLLGLDSEFASEPYSLTISGKTVEGSVNTNGYIFTSMSSPPVVSEAITLRLCSGPAIRLKIGTNIKDSESAMLESSSVPAPSPKSCKASSLNHYTRDHPNLNRGMPYVFSEWAIGLTPMELNEQKNRTEQDLRDNYSALAAANNDRLAWLGALPPKWSDDEYIVRENKLYDRLKADMTSEKDRLLQFQCKAPAQVGPTPNMEAVEAYIGAFPNSMYDQALLNRLYAAAAKGNWLAVAQVYTYENQMRREGENRYLRRYRMLQLQEWLQVRKIGAVYSEFSEALNASGYVTDGPYFYAALHHSYPSQYKMGEALEQSSDKRDRLIGRRMKDCALNALPAYRKFFQSTREE